MNNIKIEDLKNSNEVSAQEATDVKGGPIYMKYNDMAVKGDVEAKSTPKLAEAVADGTF